VELYVHSAIRLHGAHGDNLYVTYTDSALANQGGNGKKRIIVLRVFVNLRKPLLVEMTACWCSNFNIYLNKETKNGVVYVSNWVALLQLTEQSVSSEL
jgi:hypothetical protein